MLARIQNYFAVPINNTTVVDGCIAWGKVGIIARVLYNISWLFGTQYSKNIDKRVVDYVADQKEREAYQKLQEATQKQQETDRKQTELDAQKASQVAEEKARIAAINLKKENEKKQCDAGSIEEIQKTISESEKFLTAEVEAVLSAEVKETLKSKTEPSIKKDEPLPAKPTPPKPKVEEKKPIKGAVLDRISLFNEVRAAWVNEGKPTSIHKIFKDDVTITSLSTTAEFSDPIESQIYKDICNLFFSTRTQIFLPQYFQRIDTLVTLAATTFQNPIHFRINPNPVENVLLCLEFTVVSPTGAVQKLTWKQLQELP